MVFAGHSGAATNAAYDSQERMLASSGADGSVRVWDPISGVAIGEPLRGHRGPQRMRRSARTERCSCRRRL
ncbi:WD40 repeat domain-containing protein [Modestobacter excelsi]|uniref:WD40 repeat domain-containing protein n=1 Tax=Modestobacter excelsi TaxID=2213161 RepID=UPI0034E0780F